MAAAKSPELPATVPAPEVHTAPAGNILPKHIGDTPVPEAKPGEPPLGEAPPASKAAGPAQDAAKTETGKPLEEPLTPAETPETAPIPENSPLEDHVEKPEDGKTGGADVANPDEPARTSLPGNLVDPRSDDKPQTLMPPSEISCRQRLRSLGVDFRDHAAESDPAGCAIPYPVSVTSLGRTVALEPAGEMTCAMAEAIAEFTAAIIEPAAKRDLGADLKSIAQASAYVCRPRAGTHKLSEHAFGNAIDIARFNLADGRSVDVRLDPEPAAAKFLAAVRSAACGPFKTVLGPGSNADHATHFHLDLAPRRHGGTVCE